MIRNHALNRVYSLESSTSTITVLVRRDGSISAKAVVEGQLQPWQRQDRHIVATLLRVARRMPAFTIERQFVSGR